MSQQDIIRAWKDEKFRKSLNPEQLQQLPQNPAGIVELSDDKMESLAGGFIGSKYCCGGFFSEVLSNPLN